MARHKDVQWNLPDGVPDNAGSCTHEWVSIHAAVLMDIRDELKRLNAALYCPNALAIPGLLRSVVRNTAKKRRKK